MTKGTDLMDKTLAAVDSYVGKSTDQILKLEEIRNLWPISNFNIQVKSGDPREPGNQETVLEPLVLLEVGQLGIHSGLVLDDSIETSMILFQDHHPILKNAS